MYAVCHKLLEFKRYLNHTLSLKKEKQQETLIMEKQGELLCNVSLLKGPMIVNDTSIIHGWQMTILLTKMEALFTIKNVDYFKKGNEIAADMDHWRYLTLCKFNRQYMILSLYVYISICLLQLRFSLSENLKDRDLLQENRTLFQPRFNRS